MIKIFMCLLLASQAAIAKTQLESISLDSKDKVRTNIYGRKRNAYKMKADETYFSKYDDHNHVFNTDADIEFDVFGLSVELRGYTQQRAYEDYYEDLN